MKFKSILTSLLMLVCSLSQAQEKDYKPFLETLFLHAGNDFKDIAGKENESGIFRDSKLKPDVGEMKISIMSYGANLNWIIPLSRSQKIQKDVEEFVEAKFSGKKDYIIADSYDLEDENFNTKNVYLKLGDRKPKLILQTLYYKDIDDPKKSSFSMIIYGKK